MRKVIMSKKSWIVLLLLNISCFAGSTAQDQSPDATIPLWSGPAPLSTDSTAADQPFIDVYLPAENPTQTGVLVIPGGAYGYLAAPEGKPVAIWLQEHGITAFVLHYRVAPYHYPSEMLDGLRALRLIRFRAKEFNLSENRIGVWGFSAGGHLASYLMTQWQQRLASSADAVDEVDAAGFRNSLLSCDLYAARDHPSWFARQSGGASRHAGAGSTAIKRASRRGKFSPGVLVRNYR
jgi:acetyl esterase/lipase